MAKFASITSMERWSNVLSTGKSVAGEDVDEPFTSWVNAHFLPKFANQASTGRISPSFDPALSSKSNPADSVAKDARRQLIAVSKKHSGSLVMGPPFYSKNGTANKYSRCGAWLLLRHFHTVWPGGNEALNKFNEWWETAEKSRLCYCFECVVPCALGDHGATPVGAYIVLTCISRTSTGEFLGPEETLEEGRKWRLPLNEVWYVDARKGAEVETKLHELRWEMQDKDVDVLLDRYATPQRFLRHGETQGDVLEGVVLMLLEVPDVQRLSELVQVYNAEMQTFAYAAAEHAKSLAERFKPGNELNTVLSQDDGAGLVGEMPETYQEPTKLSDVQDEQVWSFVRSHGAHRALFQRLYEPYRAVTSLKVYVYKEALQVQLNVRKDEVFYAWPLHVLQSESKLPPLFRGMVVSFAPCSRNVAASQGSSNSSRVVGIVKLKFLNYLWRTFGIRNNLDALLDGNGEVKHGGKEAYLRRLRRGFLKEWEVPGKLHEALMNRFARWADIVASLNQADRRRLKQSYLPYLETLLDPDPNVPYLNVLLFNFTGAPLPTEQLIRLGISPNRVTLNPADCHMHGRVTIIDRLVNRKQLDTYGIALVLRKSDLPEPSFWKQLKRRFSAQIAEGQIVMQPMTTQDWLPRILSRLPAVSRGPPPKASSNTRFCFVVAVLALPPGGGKSTFFKALTKAGSAEGVPVNIVSSDDFGRGKSARQRFETAMVNAAIGSDGTPLAIVGYDKNVPNADAWDRVFGGIVRRISSRVNVQVGCNRLLLRLTAKQCGTASYEGRPVQKP